MRLRRITVLRSWNRYVMRHAEYFVFAENSIGDTEIIHRLNTITYEEYRTGEQK